MTMRIGEKIDDLTARAKKDADLALRIAEAGRDAVLAGMQTPDGEVTPQWERLMKFITDDPRELERLCGKDTVFNDSQWGLYCLAYIAGDSDCTSETPGATGMKRTMTLPQLADRDLLGTLDRE